MANADVFTFSQKDFLSASFAAFEDMRKRGHLCDLTIKVQNLSFSAHRVILTAGIPSFDSVFSGLETADKEFAVGENLEPNAFESLIDFAYTGKVTISSENVLSLLGAAQFLQLSQVQNACLTFLSKKLNSDNIGKVSTLACTLNNKEVIQSFNAYIKNNFVEYSKREEFLSLSFECIKEIISGDDLEVPNEEFVFEALIKWVKAFAAIRQGMLQELLRETRLTFLSVEYLMETVESEELVISSKDCRDLLKEVKYYHMMPERTSAVSNLKTQPRNCFKEELYAVCVCSTCGSTVQHYDSNKAKWYVLSFTEATYFPKNSNFWNSTITVNGKIYIFFSSSGIGVFSLKTLDWDILKINHQAKEGTTFVSFESKIYGFGNNYPGPSVLSFDTQRNKITHKKDMPEMRRYAAGTTLGNSIYVTGGEQYSLLYKTNLIKHVGRYSPSADQWNNVVPMLIARSHHCCTSMNGKIYVCGNQHPADSRMEVYDPFTEQWNLLYFLESNSAYISLVSDHDKIYAFTETNGEIYDTRTRQSKTLKVPGALKTVLLLPITTII